MNSPGIPSPPGLDSKLLLIQYRPCSCSFSRRTCRVLSGLVGFIGLCREPLPMERRSEADVFSWLRDRCSGSLAPCRDPALLWSEAENPARQQITWSDSDIDFTLPKSLWMCKSSCIFATAVTGITAADFLSKAVTNRKKGGKKGSRNPEVSGEKNRVFHRHRRASMCLKQSVMLTLGSANLASPAQGG